MKKFIKNVNERLRQSWKNLMNSNEKKLSEGSREISRVMTSAHKDQWRRGHGRKGHENASNPKRTNRYN